jgi:DNA repair exonuclease SbcCD ATPase subunit
MGSTMMTTNRERLDSIAGGIGEMETSHIRRTAARDALLEQIGDIESRAEAAGRRAKVLDFVHEFLKVIAEKREAKVRGRLESLVTQALRLVFDDDSYSFFIEQDVKRDQATATLVLEKADEDGSLFRTPIRGYHGGGVIDIVAFVLNAIVLTFVRPQRRQTMWLDEPFSQVSKSHRPRVADMMRWLHEETGLQFVVVTHEEEYLSVANTITKITQAGGRTRVQVQDCSLPGATAQIHQMRTGKQDDTKREAARESNKTPPSPKRSFTPRHARKSTAG